MPKKRKSQLSITMIIVAIIGLIILVVIVLMLTGNLGGFSEGAKKECADACKAMARVVADVAKVSCGAVWVGDKEDFGGVAEGCCCVPS
ncbi:MAG: hypothetical protein QGH34_00150 [Candidatus Woesearchaeota archaeon]|jgi:flagellar basal body-associated protein FliL|nr:hypothetical protein [Candidatus Woesearchaeota archaeon]|tara:strand:- start:94 stop:360 length:267 start_codon:yes stop_codon:yes gene_type:complete